MAVSSGSTIPAFSRHVALLHRRIAISSRERACDVCDQVSRMALQYRTGPYASASGFVGTKLSEVAGAATVPAHELSVGPSFVWEGDGSFTVPCHSFYRAWWRPDCWLYDFQLKGLPEVLIDRSLSSQ
jgi:hypothetical protein